MTTRCSILLAMIGLVARLTLAETQQTNCVNTRKIACGDCIMYLQISNSSTDTSEYTGEGVSFLCTECRSKIATGVVSSRVDINQGALQVDLAGCRSQNEKKSLSGLQLGLILAGSIFGVMCIFGLICLCFCLCNPKGDSEPSAGNRRVPKKRKQNPNSDPNELKASKFYYMESQLGLGSKEIKVDYTKGNDSLNLDDSNDEKIFRPEFPGTDEGSMAKLTAKHKKRPPQPAEDEHEDSQ